VLGEFGVKELLHVHPLSPTRLRREIPAPQARASQARLKVGTCCGPENYHLVRRSNVERRPNFRHRVIGHFLEVFNLQTNASAGTRL
jgi:hypothetical protein